MRSQNPKKYWHILFQGFPVRKGKECAKKIKRENTHYHNRNLYGIATCWVSFLTEAACPVSYKIRPEKKLSRHTKYAALPSKLNMTLKDLRSTKKKILHKYIRNSFRAQT